MTGLCYLMISWLVYQTPEEWIYLLEVFHIENGALSLNAELTTNFSYKPRREDRRELGE